MRDNQMMLGVDRHLDIVADHSRAASARRHRAGVGMCQRYLLIRRIEHLLLESIETPHLALQLLDLLFEAVRFDLQRLGRLLPVGAVDCFK